MSIDKIFENDLPIAFSQRLGDRTIEGANNSLIVFGTDRARPDGPATVDDGMGTRESREGLGGGKKTGTIHAVVGRKDPGGNPDFRSDDSFLYLTMRSNVDRNLAIEDVGQPQNAVPAAMLKSDCIRLVARNTVKIVLQKDGKNRGYVLMDDDHCEIVIGQTHVSLSNNGVVLSGGGNLQGVGLGAATRKEFDALWQALGSHIHEAGAVLDSVGGKCKGFTAASIVSKSSQKVESSTVKTSA